MIGLALWVMAGFLSILVYPHTPGKTDIANGEDILLIILFWPFALFLAFEARNYARLDRCDKFSSHGVAR